MHADAAPNDTGNDGGLGLTHEENETIADLEAAGLHQVAHSLMAVLMPADPPKPKNARIIRLFDYEAAKNDPQPAGEPAIAAPAPEKAKPESKSREAAKAARNVSLLAAARLI